MGEQKKKQTFFLDSLHKNDNRLKFFDFPLAQYVLKYKKSSVLFSPSGRTESFFTQDSKLYLTPEELKRLRKGEKIARPTGRLDSLMERGFGREVLSPPKEDAIYLKLTNRYRNFKNYIGDLFQGGVQGLSFQKAWNLSIVGSVIFGMILMTMIYRYLGQGVSAKIKEVQVAQEESSAQILGAETANDPSYEIDEATITKLFREYDSADDQEFQRQKFEEEIREIVKGYPIEKMVPEIAKHDRIVAAFLVAIAKKESGWGEHVPVYQGQDCHNLWGWRGKNPVGSGGHTCFASSKEAVDTVAKRIEFLVSNKKLNTPKKMIVWKCGDCGWDTAAAMQSWIDDVDLYFRKLNKT